MPEFDLLSVIDGQVRTDLKCTSCSLSQHPSLTTNCMAGEGSVPAELMFVGVAPGKEDDKIGRPMTGANGRLFSELLNEAGISREQIFITNSLKCAPYSKIKDAYFTACKGHLISEIQRVKPKALVAVGHQALKWLTGYGNIRELRKHSLPCLFMPNLKVFALQQPAGLFHVEGKGKVALRSKILDDLIWLKNKMADGKLEVEDDLPTDYKMAETLKDIDDFIAELDQYEELSCDFETSQLYPEAPGVVAAIGFSGKAGHARAIPIYALGIKTLHFWTDEQVDTIIIPKVIGLMKRKKLFGHNFIQFDQKWARFMFGVERFNISFDTMLAHYLIDETKGTHDLEHLAMLYTSMSPWKKTFCLEDIRKLCHYLCKDVDATFRIRQVLPDKLTDEQKWLLHNLLIPLAHELMEMEYRGVFADSEALQELSAYLDTQLTEKNRQIRAIPEVQAFEVYANTSLNVDSPKHLSTVMEKFLKLPCLKRTNNEGYSTDSEVLNAYIHIPFVQLLLDIRKTSKLKSTYCEGLFKRIRDDGRIHTSYLIHGTETGRLSSQDPNLQNIPREATTKKVLEDAKLLKKVFKAYPGNCFVQADYSQIELRTLAMYSQDPSLLRIFREGLDVHTATAADVYQVSLAQVISSQRTDAKIVNFGIIYGMSDESLIAKFTNSGNTEAAAINFKRRHREMFPKVWEWLDLQARIIEYYGYQETYFGRRRHYYSIDKHAIRQAMNFPIQSTASDFTEVAITRIGPAFRSLGLQAALSLTVHDSIVAECSIDCMWEVAAVMKHIMENLNFPFITVPIVADFEVGLSWGLMKKIDVEKRIILQ